MEKNESNVSTAPMLLIAGYCYNRDHIVKLDLRNVERVRVHTTLGVDEYEGATAVAIARFFGADIPPIVPGDMPDPAEAGKRKKK